jgi:hypothetical protein
MKQGLLSQSIDTQPALSDGGTKTFPVAGTFKMTIQRIDQTERERIVAKCTDRVTDRLNMGRFATAIMKAIAVGWEGLTTELVVDDLSVRLTDEGIANLLDEEAANGGTLPFDIESAATLYRRSSLFADKVMTELNSWDNEDQLAKVRRLKKSSASRGTSRGDQAPQPTA